MKLRLTTSQLATFDFARAMGMASTPGSKDLAETLRELSRVLGPALVVGGIAVIHYGYERNALDINVLYSKDDAFDILPRMHDQFRVELKAKNGWHQLKHRRTNVPLGLIPEGALPNGGVIPGPKVLGGQNGFVSLIGLAWMKLITGRMKDEADLIEIAKCGKMAEMQKIAAKLPKVLRTQFNKLLAQAKFELANDPSKLPPRTGKDKKPRRKKN